MCCGFSVSSWESDILDDACASLWGSGSRNAFSFPKGRQWEGPPIRWLVGNVAVVRMASPFVGHMASPQSYLLALKYAVGLYSELVRRGLRDVILRQLADPCSERVLADGGEPPDFTKLCRKALERSPSAISGIY